MPTISNLSGGATSATTASGSFNWSADCASVSGRTNQTGDSLSFNSVANGNANWVNTGLQPNTTVRLDVWGIDSYGNKGAEVTMYYTTPSNTPPEATSGISATAVNQRSPKLMNVYWNSVVNATGYRLYKSSDGGVNYYPVVGSDGQVGNVTSYQVTVDYEWQYYKFQVTATNAYGNSPNAYSASYKSNDSYSPVINSFYASAINATSISIYAQGADTPPDAGSMSGVSGANMYLNGSYVTQVGANSSGEIFYTFTGLTPNTTYTLGCSIYDADSNFSGQSSISPSTIPNRPTNFSWTYAKSSGSDFKITASEWAAFQLKINDFRTYKFGTGNNYTFTNAYDGNDFTATHYNEVRNAIVNMNSNLPPYRSTGEDVIASEINWLRDALNAVA